MNSRVLTLLLGCALLACEKEPAISELPASHLSDLSLSAAYALVPLSTFQEYRYAVFTNSSGATKRLELSVSDRTQLQQYQTFNYNAQTVDIHYADPTDASYTPVINLRTRYEDLSETAEYVEASILTDVNPNYHPVVILCPGPSCPYLEQYLDHVEIAGLPFSRVYCNYPPPSHMKSFTTVFYTLDQGIVGFKGYDGEAWALSRFEN